MARPPVEVADVIRAAPESFFQGSRKWFTWLHKKVLTAILRCRTSALGEHVDECSGCGHRAISFNSCRNRLSVAAKTFPANYGVTGATELI
jgi:hypothetical protein